jgi:hypothetical protein
MKATIVYKETTFENIVLKSVNEHIISFRILSDHKERIKYIEALINDGDASIDLDENLWDFVVVKRKFVKEIVVE